MTSVYEPGSSEPGAGGREDRDRGREPGGSDVELVLLTSVWDPLEADIIVGRLRSAGIDAFARHEASSVVFGLRVDGLGQQDIMVRAEDLEDARFALEQTP